MRFCSQSDGALPEVSGVLSTLGLTWGVHRRTSSYSGRSTSATAPSSRNQA